MDAALAELDGALLASRWARAVLAHDARLVAACETEADSRGTTPAALIAATKKKKEPAFKPTIRPTGKSYSQLAQEAKVARDKPGRTKPENVGKGKFRRKSGSGGGGRFTSADDPEAVADGEITAAHQEQQELTAQRKQVRERRSAEDEASRRDHFEEDQSDRSSDEQDRAANDARRAARDARKAMEASEDEDLGTRVRANEDFQRKSQGEITLMQRQLAEARQLGRDDDEIRISDQLATANAELAKAKSDRVDMDTEKRTKSSSRAATRVSDSAAETEARQRAAEQKRVRDQNRRTTRETDRRAKHEARTAEDAVLEAKAQELRDRILAARERKSAAKKQSKVSRRSGVVAAAIVRFAPDLHPRGKDGKFIEKFGLVDVFGLSGFQHSQRGSPAVHGEVTDIIDDPAHPDDPIIRVKMTDPRWSPDKFGPTVDVRRKQITGRVKPKGTLTPATPTAPGKPTAVPMFKPDVTPAVPSATVVAARTPTPAMTPHPDGPHFAPLNPPSEWATMAPHEQNAWITDLMQADYTKWRGEPTGFDLTGFDPGIALNLANTYRDLTNWDPDTARRLDNPILSTAGTGSGLTANAIAVANPGTAHPGGIGEKTGPASMVFGAKYMQSMKFWKQQHASGAGSATKPPWSLSSKYGDPTLTLVHEFSHQRQFRYLDIAMRDANKAWSPVVLDDGFGIIPDSSNWPETQALRYQIQELAPSVYGKTKSSEAFAESWTAKMTGDSSPELDNVLEQWDVYMGLMEAFPADRHWDTKSYTDLTQAERDQFWKTNGAFMELPGMRDHYVDSAATYDAWLAGKETPPATTPFGVATKLPAVDWDEDVKAVLT